MNPECALQEASGTIGTPASTPGPIAPSRLSNTDIGRVAKSSGGLLAQLMHKMNGKEPAMLKSVIDSRQTNLEAACGELLEEVDRPWKNEEPPAGGPVGGPVTGPNCVSIWS